MEDWESEIDKRFSDLLAPSLSKGGSPIVFNSANSTNESDSDDPFEDILASRNINCSRPRTYLGINDIHTFPSTPLRQSSLLTDSDNLPQTKKVFNSERKSGETVGNIDKTLSKSRSKSVSRSRPKAREKKRTPLLPPESSIKTSRSSLFDKPIDNTIKTLNPGYNISYSPTASILRKTGGNGPINLLSKSPSALPNHSKPIPTFKKYSLMKTALAAKKEFEDLVKRVALKKALKKNLPPPGDDNVHNKLKSTSAKNSSFGTPAHSSSRIDSPSPARPSNTGNNSTTFVSCLDESASDERKSCQSLLNTPTSLGAPNPSEKVENTPLKKADSKNHPANSLTGSKKSYSISNKNQPHQLLNGATSSTDPAPQNILHGVVAYVEIRSGREYRNEGTQAELESWGAKVEKNFTKKVTHCFFHGGKMSSFRKAVDMKVPLVSTLWIEECKEHLRQVPLKGFEPHGIERYYEELPLYLLKTKMRRPMTDSKVPSKTWKKLAGRDKAEKPADKPAAQPEEADKLITALHSVAGDFRKASHQFDKILKSPVLQKSSEESETSSNSSKEKNKSTKTNSKIKKLIFNSSSDEDNKHEQEKLEGELVEKNSAMDDSSFELRISYDSDDLLSYAKKQAATNRCSAPGRLLTARKCKRLLTSCEKPPNNAKMKVDNVLSTAKKQASPRSKKGAKEKSVTAEDLETESNKQKAKKRKLLMNSQVISDFSQDSRENTPELPERCPYVATPGKKAKTGGKPKAKKCAPAPVFSDWESDDSVTRARRESSALFVKKEKRVAAQRSVPTIVCTSLPRSEVEAVASIASKLGKFVVEATVSERTTHLVTPTPRRTVNLLKGIARGCWVLNVKWVYESLEADTWLHEEKYEMLDFSPSVRQARLERQAFGPEFSLELFTDVGPVYVCRGTMPPQADLVELLRLCGATVVSSARAARLVVGSVQNLSPTLSARPPLLVREKWVLDSITRLTGLDPQDYMQSEA